VSTSHKLQHLSMLMIFVIWLQATASLVLHGESAGRLKLQHTVLGLNDMVVWTVRLSDWHVLLKQTATN
jgi:hypothetical protein